MTIKRVGLLVLLMCVVAVGAVVGLRAQAKPVEPQPADVNIITGSDLGFRVEERNVRGVRGTLVVRVDGRWVPVNLPGTVPISR